MAKIFKGHAGSIYFALDPTGAFTKILAGRINEGLADKADANELAAFSHAFVEDFNQVAAPWAIGQTMYRRSGQFSSPGGVTMYVARPGRRTTPTIMRLKSDRPQAIVQQTGRPIKTGYPTITNLGEGRFKIGGGKLYYVPLLSYFGRKNVVNEGGSIVRDHKFHIGKTVFYKNKQHFLLAYTPTGSGPAWSGLRKSKGPKGQRKKKKASITKLMWKAIFAIYVGKYTGIPGGSEGKKARHGLSPSKWYDVAVRRATSDVGEKYAKIEREYFLKNVIENILGIAPSTPGFRKFTTGSD